MKDGIVIFIMTISICMIFANLFNNKQEIRSDSIVKNIITEEIEEEKKEIIIEEKEDDIYEDEVIIVPEEPTKISLGTFSVSAYDACVKCCGKTDGITASGKKAMANHTIAASKEYKFGTKLMINGIVYTVEDRGGAIQGNKIDIYMNTHEEALKWGRRNLEVFLIKE